MADQVILGRGYLDILLRRSSEYAALCRALFQAGIDPQTLNVLIQAELGASHNYPDFNEVPFLPSETVHSPGPMPLESFKAPRPKATIPNYYNHDSSHIQNIPSTAVLAREASLDDALESSEFADFETGWQQVADKSTEYRPKRSLVLKNLPSGTSLKDVADVLRGGKILDIYVGSKENQAIVSFVEASVARAFLKWTDFNPVKIRGHKISVSYAEKSFYTAKHVDQRIEQGATRNILLRGMDSSFNEQRIREDLEHIHNLVVVEVYPPENGKGIVISLNAIHLALYARTCMRSRTLYRKAQITYYPDKCANIPIPQMQDPHLKPLSSNLGPQTTQDNKPLSANRFSTLALSDSEG